MKISAKSIFFVVLGSLIFSLAVNVFIIPANLGEGGVTGMSLIFLYKFGWSPAITTLIMNIVLLIVGFKFLSKRSMILTIISIISLSVFLKLTEPLQLHLKEVLVSTIFGGFLVGVGIGMIVLVGGTTAGTTILARIAHKFLDVNTSYALLFFDLIVVALSLTVIPVERALLTVLSLYIGTKAMDVMIEGLNPKKAITIISQNPDPIAKMLDEDIGRGVTILNGRGYYSKRETDVLYCVINKLQLTRTKRMIKKIDEQAFVVVHDVRDVLGNGFMTED
ncbi:YitT family protein [Macrococcoides canis]|uniref:YitT family protein n=1 Tax=Macrococcoides canis TaxID=1855823 RepID=A0A4R6C4Y6_9STAP|nr:YitT family protein [Macrococcus canis]MEE1106776.1 YitT family protein [Macrococcus canis]TDM16913.1 YitT family protein [Macrococcus canis]TDM20294.1 YitT family protein [Macrococcus canis]TDM22916.1 YitT family protein [Macrococcus canis]TDM30762.1 YitT family protein [Macrococcus canis]